LALLWVLQWEQLKNLGLGLAIGLAIGAGMDAKKSKKDE